MISVLLLTAVILSASRFASGDPGTVVKIVPSTAQLVVGQGITVYVNVTDVADLYGWEFQLDYNTVVLDLTYGDIFAGGLNTETNTFKSSTNETSGHLWWSVSTRYPTTSGITYADHAIFEIHFTATATGTSSLDLSGTILANSGGNAISHTVSDGSVTVGTLDLTVTEVEICNKHGNETWTHSVYANDDYANASTYYYPVNVTIHLTGTLSASSFNVTLKVYYDTTLKSSSYQTVSSLAGGSSEELIFSSVFHPTETGIAGRYSLKATVDSENNVIENNEANNELTKNNFMVTVMGDINADKTVNILDGVVLSLAWTGVPNTPPWNDAADLDHNDVISIVDGTRASLNWGISW
jgi:hypothetical protein